MDDKRTTRRRRTILFVIIFIITGALAFTAGSVLASPNQEAARNTAPAPMEQQKPVPPADISGAVSIQNSFRQVAQNVLPVVVEVNVVEVVKQQAPPASPFDFFFGQNPNQQQKQQEYRRPGLGSGVIVRKDGNKVYVLTNAHVVGNADEISVSLYDHRKFKAKIIGKDERLDLALIEFKTKEDVPVAKLGDSDNLYVGDWVLAVGNPYGFQSTVTAGIVSALGRQAEPGMQISGFTDYIQTDASINPGNSGGALVNLRGEIVGINSWIASRSGGSVGIGFAIPINNAKKAINDFISSGKIVYGWLGVSIQDASPNVLPAVAKGLNIEGKEGSLVVNVYHNSPADKAGLLPGDYITMVGDTSIKDSSQLTRVVGNLSPGKTVDFKVIRYGQEKTLSVTLDSRKSEEALAKQTNLWPGMTVVGITDDIRKQLSLPESVNGVVIAGVFPKTSAEKVGLKTGDVVTEIEKKPVNSVMDFYKLLNGNSSNEVMFKVYRDGNEILLGVVK